MSSIKSHAEVQKYSKRSVVLAPKPRKKPKGKSDELTKLNALMNADAANVKRLASANCRRLAGKSHL